MSRKIRQTPGDPPTFVTHYIEPLRQDVGPRAAIVTLMGFKIDWQRYLADMPVDDQRLRFDSYDKKGLITIDAARAFRLIDYYCDLYEQELSLEGQERPAPRDHRINWIGTQKQFRVLLEQLSEAGLVDEDSVRNYGAVFERHFLHKGKSVPAKNMVSAARDTNTLKSDHERTITGIVDQVSKVKKE